MISAFTNTFKIPELRNRVLFTLAMLVVVRIGAAITTPGVNAAVIQRWFDSQVNSQSGGSVAALFNIFSGGALENCAIFALGVMPYISASIMMQLLTAVIPQLSKLSKEEERRSRLGGDPVRIAAPCVEVGDLGCFGGFGSDLRQVVLDLEGTECFVLPQRDRIHISPPFICS